MNRQAVYHSIKSNYSFPVSDNELVIRLRVAKGDAQKVELIHSMKYDWTIRRECCAMRKEYSDGLIFSASSRRGAPIIFPKTA